MRSEITTLLPSDNLRTWEAAGGREGMKKSRTKIFWTPQVQFNYLNRDVCWCLRVSELSPPHLQEVCVLPKLQLPSSQCIPRVLQQETGWPNLGNCIAHQGWQLPPASDTRSWGINGASLPHFYQKFILWTTETGQVQVTMPGLSSSAKMSGANGPFHAQVTLMELPRTPCYGRSVFSWRPGWTLAVPPEVLRQNWVKP